MLPEVTDLLENLSTTTHEKFEYFVRRGLLPPELARQTAQAYTWFLQHYHHIQEHYKSEQRLMQLPSSRRAFVQYAESVNQFLDHA